MDVKMRSTQRLLAIVSLWVGIASTFYTAIMPDIAAYFSVSVDETQMLGMIYYLGFSCGNLLIIQTNRHFGAQNSLIGNLVIACIGLAFMSISDSYTAFLITWAVASIGIGPLYILPNIILKSSIHEQKALVVAYGKILTFFTVGACLGPGISGAISDHFGWHTILTLHLFISFFLLISSYYKLRVGQAKKLPSSSVDLVKVTGHSMFIPILISIINTSGYLVSINIILPVLLFLLYDLNALQVGLLLLLPNLCIVIGSQFSRLKPDFEPKRINLIGATIGLLSSLFFMLVSLFYQPTFFVIMLTFCSFGFCRGLSKPSSLSLALRFIHPNADILLPLIMGYSAVPTAIIIQIMSIIPEQSITTVSCLLIAITALHFWCARRIYNYHESNNLDKTSSGQPVTIKYG